MAQPQETPELRSLRSGGIAAQPLRAADAREAGLCFASIVPARR
jgi:hypothetical protein